MLLLSAQPPHSFLKGMLAAFWHCQRYQRQNLNWPLLVGGRGDVFYPRNDYFSATAYSVTSKLLVGTVVGGAMVMLSFHHTYRRVKVKRWFPLAATQHADAGYAVRR